MFSWRYVTIATVFLLAGALTVPSFLNGIPFLYFDSGYYIVLGVFSYSPDTYFWRPLTYSYFLRGCFFFFQSLNWAIFVQNLILVGFIFYFMRCYRKQWSWPECVSIFSVFFLTSYPNLANHISPDVWAGVLPLACAQIFIMRFSARPPFLIAMIVVSATHYVCLLLGAAGVVANVLYLSFWRVLYLVLALVLPLILVVTVHFLQSGKFIASNVTEIFFFSKLADLGLLTRYLDQQCPTQKLKMCEYRAREFEIWDTSEGSQIAYWGGYKPMEAEIKKINRAIIFGPLFKDYVVGSLRETLQQMTLVAQPLVPITEKESLWRELDAVSLRLGQAFKDQELKKWPLAGIYQIHRIVELSVLFFSFVILGWVSSRRKLRYEVKIFLRFFIGIYLFNALICGFLTEPLPRYSDRLWWALPLLVWLQFRLDRDGDRQASATAECVP